MLMGSAFADCSVLLLDDGIFQVVDDQDARELGTKDYSVSYKALADYGVEHIYCSDRHLEARNLTTADLLVAVEPLSDEEVRTLLAEHDVILSF